MSGTYDYDVDYTFPSSPDSDRLVINETANTPSDESDLGVPATRIPVDGSYVTITVNNYDQSETPSSEESLRSPHHNDGFISGQGYTSLSDANIQLNKAFFENTARQSAATPFTQSPDIGNIQRRLWFGPTTTTHDVTLDAAHRSLVLDNVISLENDFGPRHSTPARGPVPLHNPINSAIKRPSELYEQWRSYDSGFHARLHPVPTEVQQLEKPPYTYIAMCVMAIHLNSEPALTLAQIRQGLTHMFPYFRSPYKGWRRSVGNTVRSKYFKRIYVTDNLIRYEIAYDQITLSMFRIQGRDCDGRGYKMYLHDQLGVPAVPVKGLDLPPKPTFASDSLATPSPDDIDLLCSRKETMTPASSDTRSDDVSDFPPVKRQRFYEPMSSVAAAKQTVMVEPTPQVPATSSASLPSAETLLKPVNCFRNNYNQQFPAWNNNAYGRNFYPNAQFYPPPSYPRDSACQSAPVYDNMAANTWMQSNTNGYRQSLPTMNSAWWSQPLGQFTGMSYRPNPWNFYPGNFQEWCPAPLNLAKADNNKAYDQ